MASNSYIQYYSDGTKKLLRRRIKQGRKSNGLAKPKLIRLYEVDEEKMKLLKNKFGIYWNENDFIRSAVSEKLSNSVYIELLKS